MPARHRRRWVIPALAAAIVMVLIAGVVFVLSARSHGQSAPAASIPSATPTAPTPKPNHGISTANVQVLERWVNSGDKSQQQLALLSPLKFTPTSAAMTASGPNIKFHADSFRRVGQQAVITATDSDGHSFRVGLKLQGGIWHIWRTKPGSAQTTAFKTASATTTYDLVAARNTATASGCLPDIGRRLPVILIHGFLSKSSIWGTSANPSSMVGTLDSVRGTYVTTFDYSSYHTAWVDNPSLGPALAQYIQCVSASSLHGGGTGKVVLVGHSMGGLLARWAVTKGGVAKNVGLIVDIGTPNDGAALANLTNPVVQAYCNFSATVRLSDDGPACDDISAFQGMSAFSSQIESLPFIPNNVQVHAIVGDVRLQVQVFGATAATDTHSDLVVDELSARQMREDDFTEGYVLPCTNFSCWHKALPDNQLVKRDVAATIRAYLANHPLPVVPVTQPTTPSWTRYWTAGDGQWRVHGSWFTFKVQGSGLTGLYDWADSVCDPVNAPHVVCTDEADLTVVPLANGSIKVTLGAARSAPHSPTDPNLLSPDQPHQGDVRVLTPNGPGYAQVTSHTGEYANANLCQTGATSQQHFLCNA